MKDTPLLVDVFPIRRHLLVGTPATGSIEMFTKEVEREIHLPTQQSFEIDSLKQWFY
jgi:hypothetical protein